LDGKRRALNEADDVVLAKLVEDASGVDHDSDVVLTGCVLEWDLGKVLGWLGWVS